MKTFQILTFFISSMVFISCGGNKASQESGDSATVTDQASTDIQTTVIKKYPVKSGIVTFENDMLGIKQKSVLYFDDYGMKEADEKYDGDNIKEVTLCDGKKRYTIIFAQKTAYDAGDCYRGVAYKFDWDEISKADKEYKVKKQPNITVAGKDCDSYSLESGSYPTVFAGWNNILLYQNTKSQFGNVIMKAVKLETDIAIPAEKLQVPAGFEIKKSGV